MKNKYLKIYRQAFGAVLLCSALVLGNCGEDAATAAAACVPSNSKPASVVHEIFVPANVDVSLDKIWIDGDGPDSKKIVSAGLLKSCTGKTVKLSQPGTTKYVSVPSLGLGALVKSANVGVAITAVGDEDLVDVDLVEEVTGGNCPPCYGTELVLKAFFHADKTEEIRKSVAYVAWHDAGGYDTEVSLTPRRKTVNSQRTSPQFRGNGYSVRGFPSAVLNGKGGGDIRHPTSFYKEILDNLEDGTKVHPFGKDSGIYTFVSGTHLQQGTEEEDDDEVLINVSVYNTTDDSIDSFMNTVVLMNGVPIPEKSAHFGMSKSPIHPETQSLYDEFGISGGPPTEYDHLIREASIGEENTVTIDPGMNVFTYVLPLEGDGWASIINPGEPTMSVAAWLQDPSFKDNSSPVISAGESNDVYIVE